MKSCLWDCFHIDFTKSTGEGSSHPVSSIHLDSILENSLM